MLSERLSLLDPSHKLASPIPDGFPDANGDLHTDSESWQHDHWKEILHQCGFSREATTFMYSHPCDSWSLKYPHILGTRQPTCSSGALWSVGCFGCANSRLSSVIAQKQMCAKFRTLPNAHIRAISDTRHTCNHKHLPSPSIDTPLALCLPQTARQAKDQYFMV